MLEHVSANQTRFVAPGLAPDPRGVALGRSCVVLLPSVDRVVGLLRGLSERGSLDDLLPALKIIQVQTQLRSKEIIVQLPVVSSYAADSVAQVALLMGGLTFTGTTKHFVKFRDSHSPMGYDVDSLHAGAGDFILYAEDFVQSYSRVRDLSPGKLLLSLSVEPVRQDRLLPDEPLMLRVVQGIWRSVVTYLHRNNLPCEVTVVEGGGADAPQGPQRFYLVRTKLLGRMEALFRQTPGIEVYRVKTELVAVQVGFRHPVELHSCAALFDKDKFYLFSGTRDCLEVVSGPFSFVSSSALVNLGGALDRTPIKVRELSPGTIEPVEVSLRLVTSSGGTQPVRAARLPVSRGEWVKKLTYLLPAQALEGIHICVTRDHIYLYCDQELELFPLGDLFYQVAEGIMVPLGHELIPRVHPDVLLAHLAQGTGNQPAAQTLFFFCPGSESPVRLSLHDFAPLGRKTLAPLQFASLELDPDFSAPAGEGPAQDVQLVNDPVGLFPLWGFSSQEGEGEGES